MKIYLIFLTFLDSHVAPEVETLPVEERDLFISTELWSQLTVDEKSWYYRKISNIRRTKSPNLDVARLIVQLSSPNPKKPGVTSRMKM